MSTKNKGAWKGFERKIAKKFDGERIIRPDWGTPDIDVVAYPFGIECKYRINFSFEKALQEAEMYVKTICKYHELIPIAVCQHPGTKNGEFVAIRFGKFLEVMGLDTTKHKNVAEEIFIVPLKVFLNLLEKNGVKCGTENNSD